MTTIFTDYNDEETEPTLEELIAELSRAVAGAIQAGHTYENIELPQSFDEYHHTNFAGRVTSLLSEGINYELLSEEAYEDLVDTIDAVMLASSNAPTFNLQDIITERDAANGDSNPTLTEEV